MKKYRASVFITLRSGVVMLTADQARRRTSEVRATDVDGVYEITGECRFKAGEEFAFDGDIPKGMAGDVEAVSGAAAAQSQGALIEPRADAPRKGRGKK